ncbi:MAG: cyclic nucleotide-binding domain-containing protein, partial [Acidobacteria bacterium]|nr:cyclic nucleotide-binding domain-containing protein [Acidobacteriota bacterium]
MLAAYLAAQHLFGVLPQAAIHDLAQQTIARSYRKGHYLYQRGDPPTFVFIITSGLVAVTDVDEQGHVRTVQTHRAGNVFGLSTLLLG